ncbi:MAG: glycosyltransferase [Candidatus Micrarchaeaceae archaeon]
MQENKTENYQFKINPKISIITPTYNTPKTFLIDMIESVLAQTYSNWELYIADGASKEKHIKEVLDNYTKKDSRIKVKYLPKNKGIAGNSNEAISLASGDYIAFLDHDDTLVPFALYEVVKAINENPDADFIYSDEDKLSEDGKKRFDPRFKPDFAPDTLRSYNYICHLTTIKKELLEQIGYFREGFEGSQDYDLILRATEKAKKIIHIPKILYHWRVSQNSTAQNQNAKLYAYESAKKALKEHLERLSLKATVRDGLFLGSYKIDYKIINNPKVSIIIPNKDHKDDLEKCISSIINKSTYKNYEIIIAENNSTEQSIFDYYKSLEQYPFVKIIIWDKPFNYSAINNYAVKYSSGEILLFLNNDTEVITPNWIEEMLMFIQRKDVGAVGAKLLYPDNTIQHAGLIIGINKTAEHCFKYFDKESDGYFGRLKIVQNLSAVTGACLMIKKIVFEEVNGFDEGYPVAFNDIDLCMKVRNKDYLIVWTPYALLYHYEFKSRGVDNTPEKQARANMEVKLFCKKWDNMLKASDPYYNPNLTIKKTDFSIVNYEYDNKDEKYSSDGIFYLRSGDIKKAKNAFSKALKLNPNNADALFCLGTFCLNDGNIKDAATYFNKILDKKILEHDIQLSCVYNNLGVANVLSGNLDKGFELIEKAYKLNPMYQDAQYNLKQKSKNNYNFKITRKLIM